LLPLPEQEDTLDEVFLTGTEPTESAKPAEEPVPEAEKPVENEAPPPSTPTEPAP
jgi:hypothetical protein